MIERPEFTADIKISYTTVNRKQLELILGEKKKSQVTSIESVSERSGRG